VVAVAHGSALLVGTMIGLFAGYFQSWLGAVLMRLADPTAVRPHSPQVAVEVTNPVRLLGA
jgi:ABC-type dipeptide/oligopeptide/nickel transport system permease subunit